MRSRALPWIVASLALHAAVVSLVRAPALAVHASSRARERPFTLELEVQETPADEPEQTLVEAERARESEPERTPARRARSRRTDVLPSEAQAPEPTTVPSSEPDDRGRARDVDLSPRAAALSVVGAELREVPAQPSAEQVLNEVIARGAMRKRDVIPDPVLQPRAEGGYAYHGSGFDAVIESDGQVKLNDRFGHVSIVPKFAIGKDGSGQLVLLHGSFRLFEWLDRRFGKNDPYQSERRWFLERTRALRERLTREHARKHKPAAP